MKDDSDKNLPADFDDLSPLLDELRAKGKILHGEAWVQGGFTVPEDYFAGLAENISRNAALQELKDENAFIVPENYFENFSENIAADAALQELKGDGNFDVPVNYFEEFPAQISSLVALNEIKNKETFDVPEGYFSAFDETLNTKLALDNLRQDEGFVVPENYFEKLSGIVIARAKVDDAKNAADTKDVPPGYFDSLADRISARIAEEGKVQEETGGKVISFADRLREYSRPVAIAASVVLLIAVSIFVFNRYNSDEKKIQPLAKVDTQQHSPVHPAVPQNSAPVVPLPPQNRIAAQHPQPVKHNSHHTINHAPSHDVKLQMTDVMTQVDQLDINTLADYVQDDAVITTVQQAAPGKEAVSNYILNSGIDADDLINGINIQKP